MADYPPRLVYDANDPFETWAAQDFRSAKALFVPSLKRGIVPSIGMHTTSGGRGRMAIHIRRREFIFTLGGAAAAWPLAARAQQGERVRRIGVLISVAAHDPEGHARQAAFLQELAQLGWTVGRNVRFDIRWAAGKADDIRKYVTELVALAPDVILAAGGSVVGPLLQVTRTVPIVFTQVTDPVGAGFVDSLARPGGNATGFINFEYGMSVKWLELLKQIVPSVRRVAVLRDPAIGGVAQLGAIQGAAPSFGVEVSRLACAMPARSSAPSRHSRAPLMAA
jgi:ABC-type uncharacterized transport system substrate-binding protein